MEGRDHTGVFVACTASADPKRVDEWNRWYVERHMPDVLGTGIFEHATRFHISEGFHMPADGTHLQIYETSRPDVPGALADLTTALAGTDDGDRPPSIRSLMSTYTKISEHGNGEGRRANGVVMVFTDCTDPAQEDAFNEWYEFHGGHVLEMMDYYAVTRYRADNPEHWQAKYLAIYETWREDPGTVQREGWDQYFSMSPEERGPDAPAMKLWGEIAFEREL
jgi:hypothetical protein